VLFIPQQNKFLRRANLVRLKHQKSGTENNILKYVNGAVRSMTNGVRFVRRLNRILSLKNLLAVGVGVAHIVMPVNDLKIKNLDNVR